MNCPMTALECISCDDATGCKLLSARARCVAPDCSCEMECRAEPWAKHGRGPDGPTSATDESPAPQGREPARGGSAHCLGKAPSEAKE